MLLIHFSYLYTRVTRNLTRYKSIFKEWFQKFSNFKDVIEDCNYHYKNKTVDKNGKEVPCTSCERKIKKDKDPQARCSRAKLTYEGAKYYPQEFLTKIIDEAIEAFNYAEKYGFNMSDYKSKQEEFMEKAKKIVEEKERNFLEKEEKKKKAERVAIMLEKEERETKKRKRSNDKIPRVYEINSDSDDEESSYSASSQSV